MTRLSLITFVFLFFLSSCGDDPIIDDGGEIFQESYIPMAIGNYWVYQILHENEDGILEVSTQTDSIAITSKEIIDGVDYFKYESTVTNSTYFRRDSSGYLLDESGNIHFSPNDGEGIINTVQINGVAEQLLLQLDYSMEEGNTDLTVPAGTFAVRKSSAEVTPGPTFAETYGDCTKSPTLYFAPDIGLIRQDEHYAASCTSRNIELIRYRIN